MPLYGYQCSKCGEEFEYLQKFSDPPMTKCESCGGKLEKQLSAPAFHLKGGGWYADGYASAKGDGGKGDGKGDGKGKGGDGDGKSASKGSGSGDDGGGKGKGGKSKGGKSKKAS